MATRHASATVTLPSDTEILITRSFEATADLVWTALTEPAHLLQWWGPPWCPLVACDVDLRPGGTWRYLARTDDGAELGWHGTYLDVVAGARIDTTEVFEGFPDAESTNTMTLTEADGLTTLRMLVRHRTKENRDGHVESGMEPGMQATFDRLDDLLADAEAAAVADTTSARFRRVVAGFRAVAVAVPGPAWSKPAPCAGWTAHDIVRHLVTWVPAVLAPADLGLGGGPDVDAHPLGAFDHLTGALQTALDDPVIAAHRFDAGPPGELSVETAIGMLVVGDVLVHTWDLARASGQQVRLDAGIVHDMLVGMEPMDEMLRASGHYGPKVVLDGGADEQARLIAFTGRDPR